MHRCASVFVVKNPSKQKLGTPDESIKPSLEIGGRRAIEARLAPDATLFFVPGEPAMPLPHGLVALPSESSRFRAVRGAFLFRAKFVHSCACDIFFFSPDEMMFDKKFKLGIAIFVVWASRTLFVVRLLALDSFWFVFLSRFERFHKISVGRISLNFVVDSFVGSLRASTAEQLLGRHGNG